MGTMSMIWLGSAIAALMLLPVGLIRLIAYRSGQVDHTPTMRTVVVVVLGLGTLAALVFVALSLWFLVSGERPS